METDRNGVTSTISTLTNKPVSEVYMAQPSLPNSNPKIKICSESDCTRAAVSIGFCGRHYAVAAKDRNAVRARKDTRRKKKEGVVSHYLGGHTIAETGAAFNITYERVRQILRKYEVDIRAVRRKRVHLLGKRIVRFYQLGNPVRVCKEHFKCSSISITNALKVWRKSLSAQERKAARLERETNVFWRRAAKKANEQECWLWTGACNPVTGYGHLTFRSHTIGAHRVAFELHYGYQPKLHILHSCDNPPCVNPAHLREGTMADNMRDRDIRGRAAWQKDYEGWLSSLRSARHIQKSRKLADDQVDDLRRRYAAGEPSRALAVVYGITFQHVTRIARGEVYRFNVNGDPMPIYPPSDKVHSLFGFKRK